MSALAWVAGIGLAWIGAGIAVAVVVGRGIRNADEHCCPVLHDDIDDELRGL